MRKNVSGQVIGAQMVTASDGTAFTGSVTVYITGDNGTQAVGSVGSGACAHKGNGYHSYAPSQGETNYDHIAWTFIGSGAVSQTMHTFTGFPQTGDSFARIGASGAGLTGITGAQLAADQAVNAVKIGGTTQTARDLGASVLLSSGTGIGQISLSSGLVTLAGVTHTGAVIPTVTNLANAPTAGDLTAAMKASVNAEVDIAIADARLDELLAADSDINGAAPPAIGSVFHELLTKTAGSFTYDQATDSLEAVRDRGDVAWITGGGGGITDILNVVPIIPTDIDLANTVAWRIGLALTNAVDDLPTTAEITPGTISIDRKTAGSTSWTAVRTDVACSEDAGLVYYDEVFSSGNGYASGDSLRITLKNQKVTVAANDYEITGSSGRIFYSKIPPIPAVDWTSTERNQIRYRLGVDGTTATPSATPNLGTVTSNITAILGTNLTEGAAGRLSAAFKQFFDIAGPVSTMNLISAVTSVTNDVGITQTGADKVWLSTARSLTDKLNFGLTTAERTAIATELLVLDWTAIAAVPAARCVWQALRNIRNAWDTDTVPGWLRVYKEDDVTEAWRRQLAVDPAAQPIIAGRP